VLSTLIFGVLLFSQSGVSAQVKDPKSAINGVIGTTGSNLGDPSGEGIVKIINNVINWASAIIAAIAVAFIVYGSFVWITSGQENGQKIVIQAVVGLIVLVVSYFIAQIAVSLATTAQGQINGNTNGSGGQPGNVAP
jgi:uncharacterized membrane protein YozB (DUF420 family)